MWVSAGLGLRGGRISCLDKEEEGARGYVGGKVKCRWWWLVALLIDKGVPKVA